MRAEFKIGILSLIAGTSMAQPIIRTDGTGIVNAASYSGPGLPNSFVAQGSTWPWPSGRSPSLSR